MIISKKVSLKLTLSELKKVLGLTLIVSLFVSGFFVFAEPNMALAIAMGVTDSKTVVVTLSVNEGIALTLDNTVTVMTPISIAQDTGVATSTFVVKTNAVAGYKLELNATATPAMAAGTVTIPDASATQALISAPLVPVGTYAFGFSAYSVGTTNVPTDTWGTQTTGCAQGASSTPSTGLKYRGFDGATKIQVASNNSTTTTAGNTVVVCFMAQQNGSYIPAGNYNATIVATATTN